MSSLMLAAGVPLQHAALLRAAAVLDTGPRQIERTVRSCRCRLHTLKGSWSREQRQH